MSARGAVYLLLALAAALVAVKVCVDSSRKTISPAGTVLVAATTLCLGLALFIALASAFWPVQKSVKQK